MKKLTFIQIQEEVIKAHRIKINTDSSCWGRMHAHVKKRTVCKWKPKNSIQATFDLFHEIGHIETTKAWMRRCESEYYATVFAIQLCRLYNLDIPRKIIEVYQDYIDMELDRGLRRGGKNYPTSDDLDLTKCYTGRI